jgi:hypothetical protein
VVAALWLRHLSDRVLKTGLRDNWRSDRGRVRRLPGRKPRVLTPMAVMPVGVVTLPGAPL